MHGARTIKKGAFMNFYNQQKSFYCGVDLHARNIYICIIDKKRNILVHRQLSNQDTDIFLKILKPYKRDIVVACESCFPWYWLADLCADNGIEFIMGHALYMKAIHGGKVKNDRIDSHKIALLAQSGTFPLSYVYPREKRHLRDLLRRRLYFVNIKTKILSHIQIVNFQANNEAIGRLSKAKTRRLGVPSKFKDPDIKKTVESDLDMISHYDRIINDLEEYILARAKENHSKELAILMSVRGIGEIIGLTILLEIDTLDRFPSHQKLASYSRLVKCIHESAGKKYGTGGAKIGNPYLKLAFSEASVYVAKFNPRIKKYLSKMESKFGKGKSKAILAHKIERAVYHMLKNGTVFDEDKFLRN